MLQQQLRVGGLALATAAATATLALVTFLVTNLVLAVVAGLGLGDMTAQAAVDDGSRDAVQGVLVAAEPDEADEDDALVCVRRAGRQPSTDGRTEGKDLPVLCHERRASTGGDPPVD